MKLREAPVICHQFDPHAPWLREAADRCRRQFDCTYGTEQDKFALRKLAEDVWAIDEPLKIHRDKTRKGFRVFGLVLVNDPGFVLFQGDAVWDLPPGVVYHIDGRADHAALAHGRCTTGLFGFMAWDVERNSDLANLVASVPDSMTAYARGEPRIDVSMGKLP
jgi:hypothetical protein